MTDLLLIACLVTAVYIAVRRAWRFLGSAAETDGSRLYRVAYVVDGDTLQVEPVQGNMDGQQKRVRRRTIVRLLGIDAPESFVSDKLYRDLAATGESKAQHMARGEAAKRYLKALLEGRRVQLEYSARRTGYYGRTLARVWVLDSKGRRAFEAGAAMLKAGHAVEA